jgi:hypothetical protein
MPLSFIYYFCTIYTMDNKTHTVDELRVLYTENPAMIRQNVKPGDKIFTDNDWLENLILILKKSGLAYHVVSQNFSDKGYHEVTVVPTTNTENE